MDLEIRNINGQQPIEGVVIDVIGNESQILNNTITNATGLTSININETLTFYQITYTKLGYHTSRDNVSFNGYDDIILKYMYPISEDGIVRLKIKDLLFYDDREYCIFYSENDRLEGCYRQNDTVQLLVNKEYYLVPEITETDIFTSSNNILKNNSIYSGFIPSIIIFLLITSWIIGIMIKRIKK